MAELVRHIIRAQGQTIEAAVVLADLDATDAEAQRTLTDGGKNGSVEAAERLPKLRPAPSIDTLIRLLRVHDNTIQGLGRASIGSDTLESFLALMLLRACHFPLL